MGMLGDEKAGSVLGPMRMLGDEKAGCAMGPVRRLGVLWVQ